MNQTRIILVSIVGLGIALTGIGGFYLIDYYLFLQNCNGVPCPNFDGMRDAGRLTLSIGVVIFTIGILGLLILERETSNRLRHRTGKVASQEKLTLT